MICQGEGADDRNRQQNGYLQSTCCDSHRDKRVSACPGSSPPFWGADTLRKREKSPQIKGSGPGPEATLGQGKTRPERSL